MAIAIRKEACRRVYINGTKGKRSKFSVEHFKFPDALKKENI